MVSRNQVFLSTSNLVDLIRLSGLIQRQLGLNKIKLIYNKKFRQLGAI